MPCTASCHHQHVRRFALIFLIATSTLLIVRHLAPRPSASNRSKTSRTKTNHTFIPVQTAGLLTGNGSYDRPLPTAGALSFIVAVADYPDDDEFDLPHVERTLTYIDSAFDSAGISQAELLIDHDATARAFDSLIETFRRGHLGNHPKFFVFIAHADYNPETQCTDLRLYDRSLPFDQVVRRIDAASPGPNFVLAECCYPGWAGRDGDWRDLKHTMFVSPGTPSQAVVIGNEDVSAFWKLVCGCLVQYPFSPKESDAGRETKAKALARTFQLATNQFTSRGNISITFAAPQQWLDHTLSPSTAIWNVNLSANQIEFRPLDTAKHSPADFWLLIRLPEESHRFYVAYVHTRGSRWFADEDDVKAIRSRLDTDARSPLQILLVALPSKAPGEVEFLDAIRESMIAHHTSQSPIDLEQNDLDRILVATHEF